MKTQTKKLIIGTAMAGIFAAGMSIARIAPAFAHEGDSDKPAAEKNACKGKGGCMGTKAKEKDSCKGTCKSKHGCKGKKAHAKKKHAEDAASE